MSSTWKLLSTSVFSIFLATLLQSFYWTVSRDKNVFKHNLIVFVTKHEIYTKKSKHDYIITLHFHLLYDIYMFNYIPILALGLIYLVAYICV